MSKRTDKEFLIDIDVVTAADGAPLIIAHPDPGRYALRNTQTWTDLPLALPDDLMVQRGALPAPDGAHLAIPAWSETDRFLVFIIDGATGAVRPCIIAALAPQTQPRSSAGSSGS